MVLPLRSSKLLISASDFLTKNWKSVSRYPSVNSICSARCGVTVVGAAIQSYFLAFKPGIRPENCVPSMLTGRLRRLPISIAMSTLKPSMVPSSLRMAWGAKVASTAVCMVCAMADPQNAADKARASPVSLVFMQTLLLWLKK